MSVPIRTMVAPCPGHPDRQRIKAFHPGGFDSFIQRLYPGKLTFHLFHILRVACHAHQAPNPDRFFAALRMTDGKDFILGEALLGFFRPQVEFQENVDDLVVGNGPGGDSLQQVQGIYGLH